MNNWHPCRQPMIEDLKIAKYGLRGSEEGFGFEAMLEQGGGGGW